MSLSQLRSAQTRKVNINPLTVNISRITATVSDGVGGQVEDPYGTPVPGSLTVRVCHEKKGPMGDESSPVGLSTNLGRMIISNYKNKPLQGDIIPFEGINYKVGVVDPLIKFGGLIGYQAPLIEAN